MRDINWWLMALAFLLGLVLTFALMIRRVTREVPVTRTISAAGAAGVAGVAGAAGTKLSGAADKVGEFVESVGDRIEGLFERDTHGSGSARLTARKQAPAGYTVKFDPETKRYLVPGAVGYDDLETEWWFTDEASAKAAGYSPWNSVASVASVDAVDDVPAGPYGRGSAKSGPEGRGPAGWLIKGNADSMLFHGPDSPSYEVTIAEIWFFDEETAKAAGFEHWDRDRR